MVISKYRLWAIFESVDAIANDFATSAKYGIPARPPEVAGIYNRGLLQGKLLARYDRRAR